MQSNTARTFERSALIGRTPRELRRKAIKCFVADPAAAHLGSEGGEYLADGGSRVTSFERMARMYASCSRVMTLADASSTNQLVGSEGASYRRAVCVHWCTQNLTIL